MSRYYDKDELKEQLDISNIYDLLTELGGEPEYMTDEILTARTICHNIPNEGSRKLYYYGNTQLFHCFTQCASSFDIFELIVKVFDIQKNLKIELYDAMKYVANYFGLGGVEPPKIDENQLEDWKIFDRYSSVSIEKKEIKVPQLTPYDPKILTRFSYPRILNWENEGISREVSLRNLIGYYAGAQQITIPHFDINNRLIGIRGRYLGEDDAQRYGKYKPITINKITYSHPLSANLYNLNNSKENIRKVKTAIIFESEKATLKYKTLYGMENDISVACCGSNISSFQFNLLRQLGVTEVILAFDRDFESIGDDVFKRITKKITNLVRKYGTYANISVIFDKEMITSHKSSPIDDSQEKFEYLLKNRIRGEQIK